MWIPITVVYNALACWISVKYNQTDFWRTYMWLVIISLIPTWAIAGYFSKNLIFDGLLFDMTLVLSSPFILAYFGQAMHFTVVNWIGVVLTLVGLFLVRWH